MVALTHNNLLRLTVYIVLSVIRFSKLPLGFRLTSRVSSDYIKKKGENSDGSLLG